MTAPLFDLANAQECHSQHFLPLEAVQMSRTGRALGFDLFRFGEKYEAAGRNELPVLLATISGVDCLFRTEAEKRWRDEDAGNVRGRYSARQRILDDWNWTPWDRLTIPNKAFAYSLLWVPEHSLGPLEILASMADL